MKNIMFICTGNICRSAMADGILKKLLQDNKREDVKVYSCGIYASDGDYATDKAIDTVKDLYEVDILSHRATNIRNSNIKEMDIILCATNSHKNMVKYMYPELSDKVYTMKEFVGEDKDLDISDPWGYNENVYRKCAEEIFEILQKIINII